MEQCKHIHRSVLGFTILQIVLAGIIMLLLSFTKKRNHWSPNTLKGVPGLATPVNLLRITPHRIISAIAFASMSSSILANFFNPPSFGTISNAYGEVFVKWLTTWVVVLLQAILYFPLFGCFYASIGWLGKLMGAIYSAVTLVKDTVQFVELKFTCQPPQLTIQQVWFSFGMNIPVYMCLLILIAYYVFGFVKEVRKCYNSLNIIQALTQSSSDNEAVYYREWVKDLFNYKRDETRSVLSQKYQPNMFMFSPRFISAIFIMLVLIYQLTLFWISNFLFVLEIIDELILYILQQLSSSPPELSQTISKIYKGLQAAAVICPCITSIIIICMLITMVKSIRSDLKEVNRGKFSSFHIPISAHNDSFFNVPIPTSETIIKSSLDYLSYQVAYLIIAWTIFLLAVCGTGAAIAIIVLLFIFLPTFILPKVVSVIMTLILGGIVSLMQKCMCKLVFHDRTLQGSKQNIGGVIIEEIVSLFKKCMCSCQKITDGSFGRYKAKCTLEAKGTSIANVQLYHWWGYLFFIFNTFGGLWSSLKRSLLSVAIVMVLLIRMDRNIYIREYETCDQGYSAYIAALYLEFTQNNPIVNCFVQILLEVCAAKNSCDKPVKLIRAAHPENYDVLLQAQPYRGYFRVSRKARNMWFVAYTLLRNPGIQPGQMDKPLQVSLLQEGALSVLT